MILRPIRRLLRLRRRIIDLQARPIEFIGSRLPPPLGNLVTLRVRLERRFDPLYHLGKQPQIQARRTHTQHQARPQYRLLKNGS